MKILQVNLRLLADWRLYLVVVGISIIEPTLLKSIHLIGVIQHSGLDQSE